jgi:hypothetical protein
MTAGARTVNVAYPHPYQAKAAEKRETSFWDRQARARFVGRWLSRAGDVDTIFFLWGVKP